MKRNKALIAVRLLALFILPALLLGTIPPVAAKSDTIDLSGGNVVDDLLQNQGSTQSYICHGASWVGNYSLFDVGTGTYLVYQLKIPAGAGATVTVDYKEWQGVGNGGVHQYTANPKIRWYVTDASIDKSFDGDISDWEEIPANEEISLVTYTYSYTLSEENPNERTLYACMKFCDNDTSASGQAGWNDGAWVDRVTFSNDHEGTATSPESKPDSTPIQDALGGETIDLVENITQTDALKVNKSATLSVKQTGRWADTYALYDLGVGQYILYRITLPANDGVQVTVDYKNWADVGNGGIHQYSSKPKTVWYVTETAPAATFSGNTSGWTRIPAEEEPDLDTYTYTYTLAEKGEKSTARTLYACMVFASNDTAYHSQAGGNDGAWIDAITFDRLIDREISVSGIRLNKNALTLAFGKSETLRATLQPENATLRGVSWSSSEPTVVAVDKNGTVTAMGAGSATVTVTTKDGSYTASCSVTVPDNTPMIPLAVGEFFDTGITQEDSSDPLSLPHAWYTSQGTRSDATQIVHWDGVTFRDLNGKAYAIYQLRVPADVNARIHLDMVTDYTDANGTHNGVVSNGNPRMNIYYTTESFTLATADDALWTRVDQDDDWSAQQDEYTFTVSSMSSSERTVYVKIVSTYAASQGAWIEKLGFDTVVPAPKEMLIMAPGCTEYTVGETLDLRGLVIGVRYSDGSTAILAPEDYTVDKTGKLTKSDTTVTVTTKDGTLSGTFTLTILDRNGNMTDTGGKNVGLIAGIVGGALALGGAVLAAIVYLRRSKDKK
ncbi:MAG: Ig-like domain-containing protein [Clostridia bacterium]|nr:Ig-like domain-containing protein [Clostridia bacterium]